MLYLAADHAGYNLKEELKRFLDEAVYPCEDMGNMELDLQDDYPDFAIPLAQRVATEENSLGILICATGVGMCIAANKIKNIRAAVCYDEFTARQSREHNNANVLCLGGKTLNPEVAKKMVKVWLETEFSGEERHARRLEKIKNIEQ